MIKYWIWLTQAIGYCTTKVKYICDYYDSIEEFYLGGEKEWRFCGIFSDKELEKLSKTPLESADEIIEKCRKLHYDILTPDCLGYPECLRTIDNPPAALYVWGMLPDVDSRLSIGVVGTRRASLYGINSAFEISRRLSKLGAVIVSGGALGVDCASHRGALNADGVTICVLGCGINTDYLRENASMRSSITYKGAVISEYPPDTPAASYQFPQRNRIISALSKGILVIEAGKKSGSLITVRHALEQDAQKKIFALAGPVDPHFDGSHKLIKEKIATLVTDYQDIIDAFDGLYVTARADEAMAIDEIELVPVKGMPPQKVNGSTAYDLTEVPVHKENLDLNDDEKSVYYAIGHEPVLVDDIAQQTSLPVFKVTAILTALEMRGLVKCAQGRRYRLI